jgi:membrane associated rhomboid family serine protease
MASGPDLFVVCKSCGSEVSPYITECPYCGTRLRKRAPKLDRGGVPKAPRSARRPSLGRLRPGEIPGIRADRRPYATIALVLAALLVSLGTRAGVGSLLDLALYQGVTDQLWRTVTTLFVYGQTGYEVAALAAIFLFGWLLERRHGMLVPIVVFLVSGAAGMFLAIAVGDASVAVGGNGAALGMLAAWAMRDVLGRREGTPDDSDLLGALAIGAVLILLPIAADEASAAAGFGGGLAGVVLGLGLARLRER